MIPFWIKGCILWVALDALIVLDKLLG